MYVLAWCCVLWFLVFSFGRFGWLEKNTVCGGGTLFTLFWYTNHRMCLYALFFVLNSIVVARLPEPRRMSGPIMPDVQGRVCNGVLVYSNKGRFILRFFGAQPKKEKLQREWPHPNHPIYWREPDTQICLTRAKAAHARVQVWFLIWKYRRTF